MHSCVAMLGLRFPVFEYICCITVIMPCEHEMNELRVSEADNLRIGRGSVIES